MQYNYSKIEKIFNFEITKTGFLKNEATGKIPLAGKENGIRYWDVSDLPAIGERFGFLDKSKLKNSKTIVCYSSKGGCGKSTFIYNQIRAYALHNFKVLAIGLDFQCDLTNTISGGLYSNEDEDTTIESINNKPSVLGLYDYASGTATIEQLIQKTEFSNLDYIPETSNLNILSELLSTKNKREFWLQDNVIKKLKKQYDIIFIDLGPSWSTLTSNALVSADIILSPVECRIFHYQNVKNFLKHLQEFQSQMNLKKQKLVFIPTRFSSAKKLSSEIRKYYLSNLPNCTSTAIKESNYIEESNAQYLSIMESHPKTVQAEEMRELTVELFQNYIADEKVTNKWH